MVLSREENPLATSVQSCVLYVGSEWYEISIHPEREAWHQVEKEACFSLEKKEGSTFPDCFPIPSGYYTAQFVWNSVVNEILFYVYLYRNKAGSFGLLPWICESYMRFDLWPIFEPRECLDDREGNLQLEWVKITHYLKTHLSSTSDKTDWAFCPYPVLISSVLVLVFWKLYGSGQNRQTEEWNHRKFAAERRLYVTLSDQQTDAFVSFLATLSQRPSPSPSLFWKTLGSALPLVDVLLNNQANEKEA